MNEDQALRDVSAAQQAKAVLAHPAFLAALEAARAELHDAWEKSAPSRAEDREQAYRMLFCINRVVAHLERFIDGGKMAEQALQFAKAQTQRGSQSL